MTKPFSDFQVSYDLINLKTYDLSLRIASRRVRERERAKVPLIMCVFKPEAL